MSRVLQASVSVLAALGTPDQITVVTGTPICTPEAVANAVEVTVLQGTSGQTRAFI